MTQGDEQADRHIAGRGIGVHSENDLAGSLFILLGVFQEYQSSAIALVRLRTAVLRDPRLASVLLPSLADMQRANQALRKEVMQMQHGIAAQIAHNHGHGVGSVPTSEQAPSYPIRPEHPSLPMLGIFQGFLSEGEYDENTDRACDAVVDRTLDRVQYDRRSRPGYRTWWRSGE